MKIFDGFEEIEILPWYECKDCHLHSHFPGQPTARFFLRRFTNYEVALESLRRLVREVGHGVSPTATCDEDVLDRVAQMLATGELHAIRKPLAFLGRPAAASQAAPPPRPQTTPGPRRAPAPPPAPPPEEPVFLPNVDPAAIAQVLTHAAQSGVPFCEE